MAIEQGNGANALLEVQDLVVEYPVPGTKEVLRAVRDVSFSVNTGEAVGIVGESGCGKTSLLHAMLLLARPASGIVRFDGIDIIRATPYELKIARRGMQPIFQNPVDSLQPAMTVSDAILEPLRVLGYTRGRVDDSRSPKTPAEMVDEMLDAVGLPGTYRFRRTGELSIGERQRIAIARAVVVGPRLLVADEITSALDVTVQKRILELLNRMRVERNLAMILVSHDIGVVRATCDRIVVMRDGRIVESGSAVQVVSDPREPYTRELIAAARRFGL